MDQVGPVRDFPAASMLAGLIGNALGWHWSDRGMHQAVQDRLVFAVRRDREGMLLTDTQNAQLARTDKGWTTGGEPEGRAGATYDAPHRRNRDYHADSSVRIVLRLEPPEDAPTLEAIAQAFDRPARPLFLGRKPCLPSAPLLAAGPHRWVNGNAAHEALRRVPGEGEELRAQWPAGQGPESGDGVDRIIDRADRRNWLTTGLHGGSRQVIEGRMTPERND